jgi:RNA polymerase sigma-70 factor, ECF subfamily
MNELSSDQLSQLAERISKSDKDAFDQLFRELYASLVRYAFSYLKDKSSASDITQDAFIKLWHKRETIDADLSIKAYLYKMVRNLSLNQLRNRSYEDVGLELVDLSAENSLQFESEDDGTNHQLELLKQWIMKLPERQREAFRLSRYEGLDHEEIAEVMNVSKWTVNNHIVQAMKNIQSYYDDHYSEIRKIGYG